MSSSRSRYFDDSRSSVDLHATPEGEITSSLIPISMPCRRRERPCLRHTNYGVYAHPEKDGQVQELEEEEKEVSRVAALNRGGVRGHAL